jgi:hypothetical protein
MPRSASRRNGCKQRESIASRTTRAASALVTRRRCESLFEKSKQSEVCRNSASQRPAFSAERDCGHTHPIP